MKKIILNLCIATIVAMPTFAGGLKIEKNYAVKLESKVKVYHPVINNEGTKILFTTESYEGLNMLNINDGTISAISDGIGAGYNPVFSHDGANVYFKRTSLAGMLRTSNVESYTIASKQSKEIVPQGREDVHIVSQKNGITIKAGKKIIGDKKNVVKYAYSNYNHIVVCENGIEKSISPIANAQSYMWVSISPDGKKILFVEPFKGIFVCDINGENLRSYGKGDAPVWYGNDYVIANKSTDDGYVVLSSQLYAINLNTTSALALTASDVIVDDHSASFDAGKVVYSTQAGELNVIEIKVEE